MSHRHTPLTEGLGVEREGAAQLDAALAEIAVDLLPVVKRVSDDIYDRILYQVQEYIIDNAAFNIRSQLDCAERERRVQWERAEAVKKQRDELLATVKALAGYVQLWGVDVAIGLKPTTESLMAARDELAAAVAQAGA